MQNIDGAAMLWMLNLDQQSMSKVFYYIYLAITSIGYGSFCAK